MAQNNFKHLTVEERVLIEDRLNHSKSVRSIADELGKSPSSVLREIKRNSTSYPALKMKCMNRKGCDRENCNKDCEFFIQETCKRLSIAPYVCNSCPHRPFNCDYSRNIYNANEADKRANSLLVNTRSGFDITKDELSRIDQLASPLLKNGLSPYHVLQTYGDRIPVSESTLRRMVEANVLDARNIDLHDKVSRRPRKTTRNNYRNKELSVNKLGHFYVDFLKYIENNDTPITEMDCVEGKADEGAALLTLTLRSFSMQLAFWMKEKTAYNVVSVLDYLEGLLGTEMFTAIFPVILTDNGTEFTDIVGMETSLYSKDKRTKIFFCDPNRSDQKGSCENHHKFIRYIIPKGTALADYNQSEITLMMNHINSYKRKALFGKSAYDMAYAVLPHEFFERLGLQPIPPEKINLTTRLITDFRHSKCNASE